MFLSQNANMTSSALSVTTLQRAYICIFPNDMNIKPMSSDSDLKKYVDLL